MAEPFNLNARAAEVVRAPFPFVWGPNDETWELTNAFKLDISFIYNAITTGDLETILGALRLGMGDEQWERFAEHPLDLDAAKLLFNAWTDHAGLDEGESSASSDSLESTKGHSTPTSNGSTGSGSSKRSSGAKKSGSRQVS